MGINPVDDAYLHINVVLSKTAAVVQSGNPYLMEKVSHNIDDHKVAAVNALYDVSKASFEKKAFLGTGAALIGGGLLSTYLAAPYIGAQAAKGMASGAEEKATEWKTKAMVGIPATLLAVGAAARAGFLGDKAQDYVEGLGDKAKNLLGVGSKKKEEPKKKKKEDKDTLSQYLPPGMSPLLYKAGVAKTYCKLRSANQCSTNPEDREKIASALRDCSATLFDLMFYL